MYEMQKYEFYVVFSSYKNTINSSIIESMNASIIKRWMPLDYEDIPVNLRKNSLDVSPFSID